jgi:hypothetical protein
VLGTIGGEGEVGAAVAKRFEIVRIIYGAAMRGEMALISDCGSDGVDCEPSFLID